MQVYLVQHGEATPEEEDPARPLTDRGRRDVRRVAERAAALRTQVAEIRHSGKLRARQTAEIFAAALTPVHGIRETDGLGPADDTGKARAEVEAAREPLMLVGHLPHLRRLASLLLAGDPEREIIRFRNGAIVCLVQGDGHWLLQWVLTPELAGE
ncbi:MAG: phosphohistidine phosphatase SixA [Candidatus Methylomirabilales bacterium]